MPDVLISVRNANEARLVLETDATIIDLKEPENGPLGCPPQDIVQAFLAVVQQEKETSIALGELFHGNQSALDSVASGRELLAQFGFAKLGLAGARSMNWQQQLAERAKPIASSGKTKVVAVIYADHETARAPVPDDVLDFAIETNLSHILIDTFDKTGGNVFASLSVAQIESLVRRSHQNNIKLVLAGSLKAEDIPAATAMGVDLVGARGAVCNSGLRTSTLCKNRVDDFVKQAKQVAT